jgi:nucleotide-binding universal stress UspA family protein
MTILVGYGTSPHTRRAVQRAAEEAKLRDATLHVLAVMQHEEGDSPTRVRDEYETGGVLERELAELDQRLTADGVDCRVEVIHGRRGDVARDLLEAAKAVGAELIVIGIRHRTRVGKLVMGSVAQDIMLGARVPVLAVKADEVAD